MMMKIFSEDEMLEKLEKQTYIYYIQFIRILNKYEFPINEIIYQLIYLR